MEIFVFTLPIRVSTKVFTDVKGPNDSIAKNGQNPETSPGDLRRLAVTQTPVKNYQLTLM